MKYIIIASFLLLFCVDSTAQIPQFRAGDGGNWPQSIAHQPLVDSTYKGVQHIKIPQYTGNRHTTPPIWAPVTINKIYLMVCSTVTNVTYTGFEIRLGATTQTHYQPGTNPFLNTNIALNPSLYQVSNIPALTWLSFELDSFFSWNSNDNIVIELRYQHFIGDGIHLQRTYSNQNQMLFGNSPYINGNKIHMYPFFFGFDIEPDWDAGLVSFISPPANDSFCSGINPITVVVHNAGLQDIDSVRISWEANGVPQGTYYHINNMPTNSYDTVTIGWYNFPNGIPVNLKAYTSHPQGTSDVFNTNDTIQGSFTATKNFVSNFSVGLGNDTAICEGDTIMLSAGSGTNNLVTFLWDDNSTAQTRSVNTGGTYYVTVTDTNDCLIADTIVVNTQQPIVDLGNDTTICEGDVVIFDAQNTGATYLWDDNSTNQLRYASNAQTYYVTVTDNIGCTGSDTVNISHIPLPSGQITATLVQGLQYNFDIFNPVNVTSALWNFGDGNTANGLFVTHTYNAVNTYNVSVIMYGQCSNELSGHDEYQIIIGDTSTNSSNNIYNPQGIEIYPNPFDKGFSIKAAQDKGEMYNLKITDILGRVIVENKGTIQQLNTQLSTEPTKWNTGQYILQLKNEATGEVFTTKLTALSH